MFKFNIEHFNNALAYAGESIWDLCGNAFDLVTVGDYLIQMENLDNLNERYLKLVNHHYRFKKESGFKTINEFLNWILEQHEDEWIWPENLLSYKKEMSLFGLHKSEYKKHRYDKEDEMLEFLVDIINFYPKLNQDFVIYLGIHPDWNEGNEDVYQYGIENNISGLCDPPEIDEDDEDEEGLENLVYLKVYENDKLIGFQMLDPMTLTGMFVDGKREWVQYLDEPNEIWLKDKDLLGFDCYKKAVKTIQNLTEESLK